MHQKPVHGVFAIACNNGEQNIWFGVRSAEGKKPPFELHALIQGQKSAPFPTSLNG